MRAASLQPSIRLLRILCGPAGRERLTIRGARGGGDRGEPKTVVRQERLEQWTTRLLQADSALLAGTAGAQRGGPGLKIFWGVREDKVCWRGGRSIQQTAIMLGICPIHGDQRRDLFHPHASCLRDKDPCPWGTCARQRSAIVIGALCADDICVCVDERQPPWGGAAVGRRVGTAAACIFVTPLGMFQVPLTTLRLECVPCRRQYERGTWNTYNALRGAVKVFYSFLGSLRQVMQEGCTAACARLEIDGCIIRGVSLPTPKEETEPCEG
jgi:hypothetical protein